MIQLTITRTRSGSLTVIAETTSPSAPYTVPEVERTVFDFGSGESVSEVFAQIGEWVAGQLEPKPPEFSDCEQAQALVRVLVRSRPGILPTTMIRTGERMGFAPTDTRREMERMIDSGELVVGQKLGLTLAEKQ